MTKPETFAKEVDLCAAFIECLPKGWTAYPETGGFDIVLRRDRDGFQIGVEAKLKLNTKVILQAVEPLGHYLVAAEGPDCRAVLVPHGETMGLAELLPHVGLTAIVMRFDRGKISEHSSTSAFYPHLPDGKSEWGDSDWYERAPAKRITLPEWVPDVMAGDSAPVALTHWKIGAIKIVITLEKRGFVTRQDFAHFKISMSRWTQQHWLVRGEGGWVAGKYLPDFRAQHPKNFVQIEADHDKWKSPVAVQLTLGAVA